MGSLGQASVGYEGPTFATLYRRHFGFVWSLTAHFGVPAAAREDVAQDVWLAIHRRLDALRPEASTRAWVAAIARNVALHHHRAQGRRLRKHAALRVVADIVEPPPPADTLATFEVVLQRMDPGQREVFLLIAVEELSGPEVAAALGVPLNTVYSRLRLARARLAAAVHEVDEREAAASLRRDPPSRAAANRVWFALAMELAPKTAAPVAVASTWTAKLAVVAVSAMTTVVGTAAMGGRGDATAHARAPIEARVAEIDAARRDEAPPHPATTLAPIAAPPPSVIAAAPRIEIGTPVARPRPRADRSPRVVAAAKPSASAVAPSPTTIAAESALLGQARRALSDDDPVRARALLERHAKTFPNGELVLERRAAWARMLCASGEAEAARALVAELTGEQGRAPAVVAVRNVCREA